MCYRTRQIRELEELQVRFHLRKIISDFETSKEYNAFTHPKTPVITNLESDNLQMYNGGLVPFWAKDLSIRKATLNARIETLKTKASFKNSIKNRCLIIVDGFYEWQWLDAKGKQKQKYLITFPTNEIFTLAGLYNIWLDKKTGIEWKTYTIVTTEANKLMSEIHSKKRMPVVLSKNNEKHWLNNGEIEDFKIVDIDLEAVKV